MPSFAETINPCPFNFFSSDVAFQTEADAMVTFVKRLMGDDVLSVELTRKQIWACFEEACCEYSRMIHELKIRNDLANMLGQPLSSSFTNKYPRQTLEFLIRQAEPYASEAGVGGSYNSTLGYIELIGGQQDYDLYTDLIDNVSGTAIFSNIPDAQKSRLRIVDIFHFEPLAAQHFLLNASNMTNFLATNFNYESYVNSSVFYVLPIFEDVLRRSMLEAAFRVRRSNYSYQIMGTKLRIFPIPVTEVQIGRLYINVATAHDPLNPDFQDGTIDGISGAQNVPLDNIPFNSITQPGRQWIRQYTLALCRELLGLIRSKFKSIPVPNADLQLNGDELITQGREDKEKLTTQLKEFLENLTYAKMQEQQSTLAELLNKQLKYVPFIGGRAINIG